MNIKRKQTNQAHGVLSSIPGAVLRDIPVFATVAQKYYEKKCQEFGGPNPEKQTLRLQIVLDNYCLPVLGEVLMSELKTSYVVRALEPVWEEKPAVAERARIAIFSICEMARDQGIPHNGLNPAQWKNSVELFLPQQSAVRKPVYVPAIDYREFPRFFRLLQELDSISARALEVMALTVARPKEVRTAKWCEFNLDDRLWTIPGWKIKGRRKGQDHQIPLSDRVIEILQSLPRSESDAVFPGYLGKEFLSQNALSNTVKRVHETDLKNGGRGFFDPETSKVACASGMRRAFTAFAIEDAGVFGHIVKVALSHLDRSTAEKSPALVQLIPQRRLLMGRFEKYVLSPVSVSRN